MAKKLTGAALKAANAKAEREKGNDVSQTEQTAVQGMPATAAGNTNPFADSPDAPQIERIELSTIVAATRSSAGFMFASPEAVNYLVTEGLAETNPGSVNPENASEFAVRATAKGLNHMEDTNTNTTNGGSVTGFGAETNTTATGTDATMGSDKSAGQPNGPTTTATDPANGAAAPKTTAGKPTFTRRMIPMPVFVRNSAGTGGASIYPFDDLVEPQGEGDARRVDSFFVPATDARKEPWKSLQSAVSAATRRYATENGTQSYKKNDGTMGTRAKYDYTRKFRVTAGEEEGVKGAVVARIQ